MAGGKETPRQKMIGLMYLVLTAMLALNVSKAILKGYLSVNDSLEKSKRNMAENNKRVTEAFKNSIDGNRAAAPYYEQVLIAQKDIDVVFKYIDDVKGNMIRYVLGLEESVKVLGDTVNLRNKPQTEKIDDYDKPTTLLLGSGDVPADGPLTAQDLRKKLEALHDKLIAQVDKMQKTDGMHLPDEDYKNLKKKIDIIKPKASGFVEDGITFTWEMDQVDHLPMAAVFVNFNNMQADLKNVEAEILSVFSGASGKLAIKFDQIQARVLAKSGYVQSGDPYEADIFLGASSSTIKDGDMEIMLGIDSLSAVKGGKGSGSVPIVAGEGKYKVGTSGIGEQNYKGVIKYKSPDGSFKYYPFERTYKVAPPTAAVTAEQMNVFYAGVENPVSVAAAGTSPADIQLSVNGGGAKYVSKGPGKYIFTFTGTGDCMIQVSGKGDKGAVKAIGPPFKFRVKPLPKPDLKVGGKFGVSEMKKAELAVVGALGAGAQGFDFQANYMVVSWEISGTNAKGKYFPGIPGNGSTLSADAKALLTNPQVGTKIYIDASIKGPDGKVNKVTQSIKVLK